MSEADKHSALYRKVLASARWRTMRQDRIRQTGYHCERCGRHYISKVLALHHITYERLGAEQPEDVQLLCPPCHEDADREREWRTASRVAAIHYNARLDGWAAKVWGEDWQSHIDIGEAVERFDEWLDRRGDNEYYE